MKKLLLTLTAVAGLTFASNAQDFGFEKGNFIVEGTVGVQTAKDNATDAKAHFLNINPKAGYFVTDKIAVGVDLGYTNFEGTFDGVTYFNEVNGKGNSFSAGVFGRYYFLEVGSRFKTFTELGAGFANSKYTPAGSDVEAKANAFGVNAGIGANYFLSEKIAINFAFANVIGFNSQKPDGGKSTNQFHADLNNFSNFFDAARFGLTFKF